MSKALKDAGISALIALGIFGAMVGLPSVVGEGGKLSLDPQPWTVAIIVAVVFFGRLGIVLWQANRKPRVKAKSTTHSKYTVANVAGPLLLAVAVVLPMAGDRYLIDIGILVMTYVMLGWGLNIVVGLAGLLDLGYVAFYAVGAYSYALLAQTFGLGFWTCLPLAGLLAAFWGMLLGFPVLRLRGDYLAIVTLAFGEIIRVVLLNWTQLTGGPNGISGIPRPTLFGLKFTLGDGPDTFAGFFHLTPSITYRVAFLYYVIFGLALLTNWVSNRLRRLPLGRAWEALRED